MGEPDDDRDRGRAEHERDQPALRAIEQPAAGALARDPDVARKAVAGEPERQEHELEDTADDDREDDRVDGERSGHVERVGDALARERHQHEQREPDESRCETETAARPAVRARCALQVRIRGRRRVGQCRHRP